jgi:ryanodine receptor 2
MALWRRGTLRDVYVTIAVFLDHYSRLTHSESMSYDPRPLESDGVTIPPTIRALIERLAKNAHDTWARQRLDAGWRWGPQRDDARRLHPCLVPYEQLSEEDKELDRAMVRQVVTTIMQLGFTITEDPKG